MLFGIERDVDIPACLSAESRQLTSESHRISGLSENYVSGVLRAWGWSWAAIPQVDDDGIDGLVYIKSMEVNADKPQDKRSWKHQFTGGLIHVQVKTGASYVLHDSRDSVEIKGGDLGIRQEYWQKLSLPMALIYVKEEPKMGAVPSKAWWTDLKSQASFTPRDTILILKKNRFESSLECKPPFSRLARRQNHQVDLVDIDMSERWDLPNRLEQLTKSTKRAAWDFYCLWKASGPEHRELGKIIINRTGWSHMTRIGRPVARIQASLECLPAAARILSEVVNWRRLRSGNSVRTFRDGSWATYDYFGVSGMVRWRARPKSEVTVILRRQTTFSGDQSSHTVIDRKTWLYSIYEPGRRKL